VERLNIVQNGDANLLRVAVPRGHPHGTTIADAVSGLAGGVYPSTVGYRLASASAVLAAAGWPTTTSAVAPTPIAGRLARERNGRDVEWDDPADLGIPAPPPYYNLSPTDFRSMVASFRAAAGAHQAYLTQAMVNDDTPIGGNPMTIGSSDVLTGLDPAVAIASGASQRIGVDPTVWSRPDPLDPLSQAPSFGQPMFETLADLAPEFVLPGIDAVPPNTVALVQPNPRFVEAFMVGLNHEMTRELLWREFPTSREATYFQQFWRERGDSGSPELPPIRDWPTANSLGATSPAANLVLLLVHSDLLRRFPNATICVEHASSATPRMPDGQEKQPLFRINLRPGLCLVAFDLPLSQFQGTDGGTGWYFVVQEHPGEPRFGFLAPDAAQYNADPPSWGACTWSNLAPNAAALDGMTYVGATWPRANGSLTRDGLTWGPASDAAVGASILLRDPLRIAMHGSMFR
jgi:hypothetical protein